MHSGRQGPWPERRVWEFARCGELPWAELRVLEVPSRPLGQRGIRLQSHHITQWPHDFTAAVVAVKTERDASPKLADGLIPSRAHDPESGGKRLPTEVWACNNAV